MKAYWYVMSHVWFAVGVIALLAGNDKLTIIAFINATVFTVGGGLLTRIELGGK